MTDETKPPEEAPLSNPTLLAERRDAAIKRLETALALPPSNNIDTKASVVAALQAVDVWLTGHSTYEFKLKALSMKAADWLGVPPERLDILRTIPSTRDLRRALKVDLTTRHFPIRLPDEKVYPYTGFLGKYLLHAQGSEVPFAFHFWSAVATLGAACRRNFYVDWNIYSFFANHYIFLNGPSGSGKGTACMIPPDLVSRMNTVLEKRGVANVDWVRLLPEKVTPEKLIDLLRTNPRMDGEPHQLKLPVWPDSTGLLVAEESVILIGRKAWGSEAMIHLLTKAYTADFLDTSTIGRGDVKLRNIALSLILGSTTDWLEKGVTSEMFGGGFMGRFVFCVRGRSDVLYPKPEVGDPILAEELAQDMAWYASHPTTEVVLDDQAMDLFTLWYGQHAVEKQAEVNPIFTGYMNRKPTHALKLAMVLALSERRTTVTSEDFKQALHFLLIEEPMVREEFRFVGASPEGANIDFILGLVERHAGISRSELLRYAYRRVGRKEVVDSLIGTLEDAGRIYKVVTHTNEAKVGRPGVIYYAGPKPDLERAPSE